MVSCVVPGCPNKTISWAARFPQDAQLRDFWRRAILGGTGRGGSAFDRGYVCEIHFAPSPEIPGRSGEMYREPRLFFVDNNWREVSCCQLCLRYEPIERMYNRKSLLGGNLSLQSLAFKYFRVRQFASPVNNASAGEQTESYFCENCMVKIDATHRFGESITENGRAYERMLRKVAKTAVVFERVGYEGEEGEEVSSEGFVEEEDSKEPTILNAGYRQAKASNCEMEEKEFETIEVNDDDESEVEIKKEPDLEEEPVVRIKQETIESDLEETPAQVKLEVPDEDPPTILAKVKEEIPEEPSPPTKKPRLEYKYSCLICKEFFKREITLNNHLKEVHKDFPEDKCIECWKTILPRGGFSQCSACKASVPSGSEIGKPVRDKGGTNEAQGVCKVSNPKVKYIPNQKILNKQLKRGENGFEHYCVPCQRPFATRMLLIHHQKKLSCKQPQSVCSQCNQNFLFKENLAAHIELAHVPLALSQICEFCGKVFYPNLFKLHRALLCGENIPEPDETHLKRCLVLFYRQKLQATDAYYLLRNKFGENIAITLDMINYYYSQFDQDDFTIGDPVQTSIKQLIDENPTINPDELSGQVGVDLGSVQLQVNLLGLMQKYGRWVPQNLSPSLMKNRFNFCRALLARFKDNINLNNIILCSERWVYYGYLPNQNSKEPATYQRALLCVWWDQRGLIFHELVSPEQAACKERYHAQFYRFTKTMTQKRPPIKHQMIFQYGINDPVARQELKSILSGIGWEMFRHPMHSPDIDPTDYHLFQAMQYGFDELYFANPGQVYEWVAQTCRNKPQVFFIQGIRMLLKRWEKVVENKGNFCGQ